MPDLHYREPLLAALYDIQNGWSIDGDFYISLAGSTAISVLDLGCGTGLLADAYAGLGHAVTGIDPAAAMLEIARRRPNAALVRWIQTTAQAFRSPRRFDLIVMTGNTFQVLLTDEAILETFATMRTHLAADGRIAFETRNPAIDWAKRWSRDDDVIFGDKVIRQSRRVVEQRGNRIKFDTHYVLDGEDFLSSSELLFLTKFEIEQRLNASGLAVDTVYGDWNEGAFDPTGSETMIFIASNCRKPIQN